MLAFDMGCLAFEFEEFAATAANDNWVGVDYGYDKTHMLTAKGVTDSRIMAGLPNVGTYGAANNLNQVSVVPGRGAMTWSDAGNLNNDGKGTTYVHNALQQLIKATKADGTTYDFRYDGDGLMVEAVKNATGINDVFQFIGGLKTRYVTSATEEVAELDGNRVVTKRFIAGPAIDERFAQIDANNAVKYIHGDRQNSVIALTNATGNPILRRAYGEYGETDATQMAQEGHPFGYTGRRWFTDLGLYYYRARWYDPELGTFLETDPIGQLDYINLYSYVGLNPLNATDPSGMICTGDQKSAKCTVDSWNGSNISNMKSQGKLSKSDLKAIERAEKSMTSAYRKLLSTDPKKSFDLKIPGQKNVNVTASQIVEALRLAKIDALPTWGGNANTPYIGTMQLGNNFLKGSGSSSREQQISFVHDAMHSIPKVNGADFNKMNNFNDAHQKTFDNVSKSFLGGN